MDSKSLKKLNRRELLEVLVKISEQNESLLSENSQMKAELENRRLSAREVGTLAHAAMEANDYFVVADRAAKQYLENIAYLERETKENCIRMVEETMRECMRMRQEAGFPQDQVVPEAWHTPAPAPQAQAASSGATSAYELQAGPTETQAAGSMDAAAMADALFPPVAEEDQGAQTDKKAGAKKFKGLFRRKK